MGALNNGGPAFPQVELDRISGQIIDQHSGVSVRDYFAGKALAAMIGQPNKDYANCGANGVQNLAKFAYEYADAMLTERSKP